MIVNGKSIDLTTAVTLDVFLEMHHYHSGRVAVERNGDIVPKSQYSTTLLCDDDRIEIVHFVGGG